MILPQEFRIGNYVSDLDGNILEIKLIASKEVLTKRDSRKRIGGNFLIEEINPIPITEEILLKFGFEKKGDFWFVKSGIKIENRNNGFSYFRYLSEIKILSAHQLQNLYFALTGEELMQVSEGKN